MAMGRGDFRLKNNRIPICEVKGWMCRPSSLHHSQIMYSSIVIPSFPPSSSPCAKLFRASRIASWSVSAARPAPVAADVQAAFPFHVLCVRIAAYRYCLRGALVEFATAT